MSHFDSGWWFDTNCYLRIKERLAQHIEGKYAFEDSRRIDALRLLQKLPASFRKGFPALEEMVKLHGLRMVVSRIRLPRNLSLVRNPIMNWRSLQR